jgi:uncharacterized membrane protein (DUF485 family)
VADPLFDAKPLQFASNVADNYGMGLDGSSFPDEHQRAPRPGEDQELAMREPYLTQVLAEFEAGRIEAYDYTRRVLAINAATSTGQMQAIVDQRPDGTMGDVGDVVAVRRFDAVDLARFRSSRSSEARSATTRYVTLAVVFVLFAVLIGMGMWLAAHVHSSALTSGIGIGGGAVLATASWR